MNVEELYQPIHRQFQQMLLLLLVLTVGGILLLRWQVLPLARRLVVAEGEAREREHHLHAVMENATDAIITINEAGLIESFNAAASRTFGYQNGQVVGQNIQMLMPESQRDAHAAGLRRYLGNGKKRVVGQGAVELQGRRQDGSEFPLELGINEVWLGNKRLFIGILRDITQRVQAQAEKTRLLAILEQTPDFIGVSDMQGNLKYHNRSALRMVGLPEDADIGKLKISDMHPEWAGRKVLEEGVPTVLKHGIWQSDNVLLHRDGREIPVSQVLMVHRDRDGDPIFLSTIMRDITERKQAEQAIRDLSLTDELTGLRNRRGFMTLAEAELSLARRVQRPLLLFYADLDGMKHINDTLGHAAGDQALRDVAELLRDTFRESDIVARLGGDEFAVFAIDDAQGGASPAPRGNGEDDTDTIIRRLQSNVEELNESAGRSYRLALSVGVVRCEAGSRLPLDELMTQADAAMYRVKESRRAKGNISR